jgi:hexulose-6-phosphate isomerase
MQGRLSPPSPRRLQAFPWESWEHEFPRARALGFDCLEWLFEDEGFAANPIWTEAGVRRIRALTEHEGVAVSSVCADYFMVHPFFRVTQAEHAASVDVLRRLVERAHEVGASTILIPVLETAELRTDAELARLAEGLHACLPAARSAGVRLGLETELPASRYLDVLRHVSDPAVGAYYDTGNAAACGHDLAADVRALGPTLCGVHVKDRRRGGASVPLGQGAANFGECFQALADVHYAGPLVLQTAFGGEFLADAARHRRFVLDGVAAAGVSA